VSANQPMKRLANRLIQLCKKERSAILLGRAEHLGKGFVSKEQV